MVYWKALDISMFSNVIWNFPHWNLQHMWEGTEAHSILCNFSENLFRSMDTYLVFTFHIESVYILAIPTIYTLQSVNFEGSGFCIFSYTAPWYCFNGYVRFCFSFYLKNHLLSRLWRMSLFSPMAFCTPWSEWWSMCCIWAIGEQTRDANQSLPRSFSCTRESGWDLLNQYFLIQQGAGVGLDLGTFILIALGALV